MAELIGQTYQNEHQFNLIFTPILTGLFKAMLQVSIVEKEHRNAVQVLADLAEVRPSGNLRPICRLIANQKNFLPETYTNIIGREFSRISYLGPFLTVSVFAEDEPKVAEKYFAENKITDTSQAGFFYFISQTLQLELENTRLLLHKVFHDVLANPSSRDPMLSYISQFLKANEKRVQLQIAEVTVAGDGIMMNLLSVLQMLAVKVKLDKVDMMHPFSPNACIDIKSDTRLKLTSLEIMDWIDELSKFFFFF